MGGALAKIGAMIACRPWWLLVGATLLSAGAALAQTGPGGFDDIDDPEHLKLWLRADEGIFQDAGCSTPAEHGDTVGCWNDQTAFGFHARQTLAGDTKPLYQTAVLNGRPVLTFDGLDDFLATAAIPAEGNHPRTLIAVIHDGRDTLAGYQHIAHYGNNRFAKAYGLCFHTNPRQTQGEGSNLGNHYWATGFSSNQPQTAEALILRIEYDGIFDRLFVNTAAKDGREVKLDTEGQEGIRLGSRIKSQAGEEGFAGNIAELIAFDQVLDGAESRLVENYLSSKYDIPIGNDDRYRGDEPAQGDFDLDVAGIGRDLGGQQQSSRSGGLTLSNQSFVIDNGDYVFFGHDTPRNGVSTEDLPGEVPARFSRSWYIDLSDVGIIRGGRVRFLFDFVASGLGNLPLTGESFHLLQRAALNEAFTSIATSTAISGQQVVFQGIELTELIPDGRYFTLGFTPAEIDTDLTVSLSQSVASLNQGPGLSYTLRVANLSANVAVNGAVVEDIFPAELFGTFWTCQASPGSRCATLGMGDLRDSVDLAPGGEATYSITGMLATTLGVEVINTASITPPASVSDPVPLNNQATVHYTTDPLTVDLTIEMDDQIQVIELGDQLIYTIVVTNQGPASVVRARVTDPFPTPLTCSWACVPSGEAQCTLGPKSGAIDDLVDLAAGEQVTYTATCNVVRDQPGLGLVKNTARVEAPAGTLDHDLSSNSATDIDVFRSTLERGVFEP